MRKMMKTCLISAALAAMPLSAAVRAVPADVAAAVSAPGRPADAIALDAGRHPAEVLRFMGLRQGDRALDLSTGSGYHGEIMARAVGPRGSALAWNPPAFTDNNDRQAIAAIRQRSPNFSFLA